MQPRRTGHSRPERWRKWTERRLISVLTTPEGCIMGLFIVVFGVNLFIYVLFGPCAFTAILDATGAATLVPWWSARALCPLAGHRDNIGGVDVSSRTSYGPIDVVYTWVNGSDPVWQSKKAYWKAVDAGEPPPVGSSPDGSRRRRVKSAPARPHSPNASSKADNGTKSSSSNSSGASKGQRRRLMDEYHGGSEFDGYQGVDDYEGRLGGPDYEPHDVYDDYRMSPEYQSTDYRATRDDYVAQMDSESADYHPPDYSSFRDDYYPIDDGAGSEYRRRADYYANHGDYPSTLDDYGRYGSEDYYHNHQRHPVDDEWRVDHGSPEGIEDHTGIHSDNEVQSSVLGNSSAAVHGASSANQDPATAAGDAAQTAAIEEVEEEEDEDNRDTDNRYRDSNELLYSLRSLEKYAPWIRHVYLVTDNQVPNWLDTSNPRITVVPHEDIFPNKSHLPVFSSPSIEAHLHRIPGLSERFAYFNDDVFLGAPTWPEDFIALDGAQKVYLSWDVPKCNDGCSDTWLGDGYCDKNCNVSKCGFDYGDCEGKHPGSDMGSRRKRGRKGGVSKGGGDDPTSKWAPPKSLATCAKACPDNWIADKVCDAQCDTLSCAFDGGDCGLSRVWSSFPGAVLPAPPPLSSPLETDLSSIASNEVDHGAVENHTAVRNGTSPHSIDRLREGSHKNSSSSLRGVMAFWSLSAEESLADFQTSGCPADHPNCHDAVAATEAVASSSSSSAAAAAAADAAAGIIKKPLEALLPVPYGTDALYINLSMAFPIEDYMFDDASFDTYAAPQPLVPTANVSANTTSALDSLNATTPVGAMPPKGGGNAAVAESTQQPELEVVQNAVLLKQHAVLVLVLHTQAQDHPLAPPSKTQLPASVVVTLRATSTADGAAPRAVRFRIEVTDNQTNTHESSKSSRCGTGSPTNCSDNSSAYNGTQTRANGNEGEAVPKGIKTASKSKNKNGKAAVADDDAANWLGRWQPWHRPVHGYATSCLPAAAPRARFGPLEEDGEHGDETMSGINRSLTWNANVFGNSSSNITSNGSGSSNSSSFNNGSREDSAAAVISSALLARLGPPLSHLNNTGNTMMGSSAALHREVINGRLAEHGGFKLIYDGRVDKHGMGGLFLLPRQHATQNSGHNTGNSNSSSLLGAVGTWPVDHRVWQTGRLTVSQSGGFNGATKRRSSAVEAIRTTAAHAFPIPLRAYTHFASSMNSSSSGMHSRSSTLMSTSEQATAWGVTPKGVKPDKASQSNHAMLAAMHDRSTNHTSAVEGSAAAQPWAMRLALPEPKRSGPPRQEHSSSSSSSASANSQWYMGRVQLDLEPPLGDAITSEAACTAAGFVWEVAPNPAFLSAAAAAAKCKSGSRHGCKKEVLGQCVSHPLACAQVIVEWPPLPHSNEWLEKEATDSSRSHGHRHHRRRRLLATVEAPIPIAEPEMPSAKPSLSASMPAKSAPAFVSRRPIRMTPDVIIEESSASEEDNQKNYDEIAAITEGKHSEAPVRRSLLRKGHVPQQPARLSHADSLDHSESRSEKEKYENGYWGLPARLVPSASAVGEAAEEILLSQDYGRSRDSSTRRRTSSRSSSSRSTNSSTDDAWAIQRASWWARMAGGLAGLQSGRHTSPADVNVEKEEEVALYAASQTSEGGGGGVDRRRSLLMDTFGDSLIFVNQLYNAQFGTPDSMRKVPAHMPHFIDTTVMKQLQATFPDQWDATSTHRFRSPTDMQYGFSYFYFLQNQASARDLDWESLWEKELDVDGSGFLDENELLTLTSMAKGKEPDGHDVEAMRTCMTNAAMAAVEYATTAEEHARADFEAAWRYDGREDDNGRLWRWVAKLEAATNEALRRAEKARRQWLGFDAPLVDPSSGDLLLSIEALVRCDIAVEGLRDHARKPPTFEKITHLSEVAFEMIGDDFNRTIDQLNSIRARKTKFVCVNDDMQHPTPDMVEFLQAFYRSFFPHPSQFELPPGSARNPPGVGPKGLALRRWVKRCSFALIALVGVAAGLYWLVMFTNPSDEDDEPPTTNGSSVNEISMKATKESRSGGSGRRAQKKD